MLKKWIAVVIASCLILTSTVFVLAQDNPKDMQKMEAKIMKEVMARLENEEEKENVIYIDKNGNIYSNKKELKQSYQKHETNEDKGTFKIGNIEYALPLEFRMSQNINAVDTEDVIVQSGTGAYRRILSKTGYRKAEGYAKTTSDIKIIPHTTGAPNTVPYMYLGGHTSNGEIDAGIAYIYEEKAWFPYFKQAGVDLETFRDLRIEPGTQVFIRFYISAQNQVVLYVQRSDGTGKTIIRDIIQGTWNPNGTGVQMKRLTSLAQQYDAFDTGEYFLGSKWLNLQIANPSTMTLWDSSKTSERKTYPNTSIVTLNTVHQDYEEAVDIDYR